MLWVYSSGTVRQIYQRNQTLPGFKNLTVKRFQCVETQSPLNPGDSGGPVVNDSGELIAVNDSITVSDKGNVSLRSFAIDVHEVRDFLEEVRPLLHPQTPDDYQCRGLRHLRKCAFDEAIADFDEVLLRLKPGEDRAGVLSNRSSRLCWAGRPREAPRRPREGDRGSHRRALSRPDDPELLIRRGEFLRQKMGSVSSARADLEQTLASAAGKNLDPVIQAKVYYSQQLMLPEEDRARQIELLNRAIQLDPRSFQYHMVRGARLNQSGQLLPALKDTRKAIELFTEEDDLVRFAEIGPELGTANHNLGHILHALKKPSEALKSYKTAVDLTVKTRPHTVEEARYVMHIGREMDSWLCATGDAKKALAIAERSCPRWRPRPECTARSKSTS